MSKSNTTDLNQVKSLFHYFGFEQSGAFGQVLEFRHKFIEGNACVFSPYSGIIGRVTFSEPGRSDFLVGSQTTRPKTWEGLFTAVLNHTRRILWLHHNGKLKRR